MKVSLLAHTPEPEQLTVAAALLCYQKGSPELAYEKAGKPALQERLFRELVRQGHGSVLEHAHFTFGIEGISRACSHQLVRHRISAYNQQSQRYVDVGDPDYFVVPAQFEDDERFQQVLQHSVSFYREIVAESAAAGKTGEVVQQDARYAIPNAGKTNLIWTTNLRNLLHVCHYRLCKRAQWEIRQLMAECRDVMSPRFPLVAQFMVVKCHPEAMGYCDEGPRTCGFRPLKEDVVPADDDCPPFPRIGKGDPPGRPHEGPRK
jgi:thymidylate synthase (FAD)